MRPRVAEDVLVQVLAGADAQDEAIGEQAGRRRAACATIAGWIRIVGQVTPVTIGTCSVFTDSRPARSIRRAVPLTRGPGVEVIEIVRKSAASSASRP